MLTGTVTASWVSFCGIFGHYSCSQACTEGYFCDFYACLELRYWLHVFIKWFRILYVECQPGTTFLENHFVNMCKISSIFFSNLIWRSWYHILILPLSANCIRPHLSWPMLVYDLFVCDLYTLLVWNYQHLNYLVVTGYFTYRCICSWIPVQPF